MRVLCGILILKAFLSLAVAGPEDVFRRADRMRKNIVANTNFEAQPITNEAERSPSHFLTEKTKKYVVDGKNIPEVNWDIGESYAGLMPISGHPDESRKLFFWFWPSKDKHAPKEIAIWFNGGPGCSSMIGFLSENGPFTWLDGTYKPVRNNYDWRNLTNVMWVEQPVGVGFTQGKPNITNEVELAKQFVGFYEQFSSTFDMKGWNIYLTGESYAGFYIPYIANQFIKTNSKDMPLKGIHINDPILGDDTTQQGVTVVPFVEYWNNMLGLSTTTMANLTHKHESCGYKKLLEDHFTYPAPQKKFPTPRNVFASDTIDKCDTLDYFYTAANAVNPCFNVYRINNICPLLFSPIGPIANNFNPAKDALYFNRTDVQKALNANVGTAWEVCSSDSVFVKKNGSEGSDRSIGPALNGVLQNVIEHTNNVIVGSGNLDSLLNTNGTLFVLQNLTWNGWQGFKEYPGKELFAPFHPDYNAGSMSGYGVMGWWGRERGLTFYQVQLAGHPVPEDAPGASFRVMEMLLGRINDLSQVRNFTTEGKHFM